MTRVAVALAVVIALAAGVWMLWPDGERPPTTTSTLPLAAPASSSTSTAPLSTTTTADDHVVDTVEEAEAILRELWFGWFEGIYNEDENRIREVVISDEEVEDALGLFGELRFERAPSPEYFEFTEVEILHSDPSCLAVWTVFKPGVLEGDSASSGVNVLRWTESRWKSLSYWMHRGDLWEEDCAVVLP